MSITHLHNVEKLRQVAEASRNRDNNSQLVSEARTLAYSAEQRSRDCTKLLEELATRVEDITAMQMQTDARILALEQLSAHLEEQYHHFNEIAQIITEDHHKIDEILGNLHTGFTPRYAVPSSQLVDTDPMQRNVDAPVSIEPPVMPAPDAFQRESAPVTLSPLPVAKKPASVITGVKARVVSR